MEILVLVLVGVLVGGTTVLFGFGGGFVTVPIVTVADAALGGDALRVAVATSALVMVVNAAVATVSTRRAVLVALRGRLWLFVLLAVGGVGGALVARAAPDAVIRWGFVAYVGITVVDLLARPGFIRRATTPGRGSAGAGVGVRTWLGLPVGVVAAFLGVGGSVMTVPMLRRAGATMSDATALANPLTLAIAAPAAFVTLVVPTGPLSHAAVGVVGTVDLRSGIALLVGAMPVIVLLRRRPPRLPDAVLAWGYVTLLVAAAAAVAAT